MWNPFKRKKKQPKYNFDFSSFYNLFLYLQNERNTVSIFVDGQESEAEMMWYEFPFSYQSSPEDEVVLKRLGFENYYEVLNKVYKKNNVDQLDVTQALEHNQQFDLMVFNFFVPPAEGQKSHFRRIKCSFYVFFVCEKDSDELNAFRAAYSIGLNYSVEDFLNAKLIFDLNNPETEDDIYIAELEKILAAFSAETQVEINKNIIEKYSNALISNEVSIEDFKKALEFINLDNLEDEDEQSRAEDLYENWKKDWTELYEDEKYYDDGCFPLRFEFLDEDFTWHSDWKFDPEDIEGIIAFILSEEDWTFNYPEETYSHDLFPYVQKALSERGLELMQMNTLADSYQFFITRKENVSELMNISNKLKLGIERLF